MRDGEALWVFVEAQQGDTVHELWAIDISEPDTVLARDRLVHANSYNGIWIRGETPWGASYRFELTDISGSSPGVPVVLLDSALDAGWLEFIDDQRLLIRATVDSTADLYLVDLDTDAPTPVRLDAGKPADHATQSFAATPDGDAVVVTLRDSGSGDDFSRRVGTDGARPRCSSASRPAGRSERWAS